MLTKSFLDGFSYFSVCSTELILLWERICMYAYFFFTLLTYIFVNKRDTQYLGSWQVNRSCKVAQELPILLLCYIFIAESSINILVHMVCFTCLKELITMPCKRLIYIKETMFIRRRGRTSNDLCQGLNDNCDNTKEVILPTTDKRIVNTEYQQSHILKQTSLRNTLNVLHLLSIQTRNREKESFFHPACS